MIPIRDDIPARRFPAVTVGLLAVNVVVFLVEVIFGEAASDLIYTFGIVPARLTSEWTNPIVLLTLGTSMYFHGGWAHLIGNMMYLWIFGDNVEDRMGRLGYFIFYSLCGVISGILQVVAAPRSPIPIIGASGAIAGVLGAYILLYPRAKVRTLVPSFYFYRSVWLPAVIVLGGWFLIQLLNGLATLNFEMQTGGVAWWAHIGGFVAGMGLMFVFRQKNYQPPLPRSNYTQYNRRRY